MSEKTDTPRWVGAILSWPWLQPVARIALTSAFLIGGIQKLVDIPGAVAEQAVVSAFLESHPDFAPAPFDAPEARAIAGEASSFRLLPHVQGTDGYFVARVVRRGAV